MARFDFALPILLSEEGFYSDDPHDTGGETWRGISRSNWPSWDGWPIIDAARSDPDFPGCLKTNMDLQNKVFLFYKSQFWRSAFEVWDQPIATKVFLMEVNAGVGVGVRSLQRACRACGNVVQDDGALGPKTQRAILASEPNELLTALRSECAGYYRGIVSNHPSDRVFIEGWLNRAYS